MFGVFGTSSLNVAASYRTEQVVVFQTEHRDEAQS